MRSSLNLGTNASAFALASAMTMCRILCQQNVAKKKKHDVVITLRRQRQSVQEVDD